MHLSCPDHGLPPEARPGCLECAEAVNACLEHRILAGTALEEAARHSLLARFLAAQAAARFEPEEVAEPAYRFRPNRLPFPATEALACECYRTEQQVKELCMRIATYGCLDGRFGLAMVAEAETFTDRLLTYVDRTGGNVAPMDRDRLRASMIAKLNDVKELGLRIRFMQVMKNTISPHLAFEHGRAGFLQLLDKALAHLRSTW